MTASRSSRRSARLFAASALFAGAAVLAAVSACSAGQITQTSSQVSVVPGANANTGPGGLIAVRDVVVAYNGQGYPQGGSAPLVARIFNGGPTSVKLVKVTADDAQSVILLGGPEPTATPTPTPTATATGTPRASGGASGSPSSKATTAPPKPVGQTDFSIDIAPTGYALLVPGQGQYLQLTGLKRALFVGASVMVTFTFADGSAATVSVPVTPPSAPGPRSSAFPVGHE